jgi:hypothetical protein
MYFVERLYPPAVYLLYSTEIYVQLLLVLVGLEISRPKRMLYHVLFYPETPRWQVLF